MNQYSTNGNGLTFCEWYSAATCFAQGRKGVPSFGNRRLRKAWRNGECPCDWAASFSILPMVG